MTFVIPAVAFLAEYISSHTPSTFTLFAKWFIFSAVGLRLFVAGIQQFVRPAFTAKKFFNIDSTESFPIFCELGFANLGFGLLELFRCLSLNGGLSALLQVVFILALLDCSTW